MSLQLRAMTAADLPEAIQLWAATEGIEVCAGDEPEQLAGYLARNPGISTVAYEGDRLVAAVLCGHDGRRGFVYHLAVSPDCRGRGVGRDVMRRSLAALKAQGVVRALLLVATENEGGKAFWQREGWEDMPFAQAMGLDL